MENVKVFLGGNHADWRRIAFALQQRGFETYTNKSRAKVSIVLGGQGINTLALTGKKVLIFSAQEWTKNIPAPHGFNAYKPVLDEYYDEFIDITGMEMDKAINGIVNYIRGIDDSEK